MTRSAVARSVVLVATRKGVGLWEGSMISSGPPGDEVGRLRLGVGAVTHLCGDNGCERQDEESRGLHFDGKLVS